MIPRSLVPRDARPPAENPDAPPRRLTTLLDDRTIIAANLPHIILDTRTSIPADMPLDVLASRQVIPRIARDSARSRERASTLRATDGDGPARHRAVGLPVVELHGKGRVTLDQLPDKSQPDVPTTGDVNLTRSSPSRLPRGIGTGLRAPVPLPRTHCSLSLFFCNRSCSPIAALPSSRSIWPGSSRSFIYMPPDVRGTPAPRVAPSPAIRVDPRVLRKIAPGEIQPLPGPKVPEDVVRNETPVEAPPEMPPPQVPQTQASSKPPDFLRGTVEEPKPQPSPSPANNNGINLPRSSSPGRSLEESAEGALHGGGTTQQFGSQIPGGGGLGGGGGQGLRRPGDAHAHRGSRFHQLPRSRGRERET